MGKVYLRVEVGKGKRENFTRKQGRVYERERERERDRSNLPRQRPFLQVKTIINHWLCCLFFVRVLKKINLNREKVERHTKEKVKV